MTDVKTSDHMPPGDARDMMLAIENYFEERPGLDRDAWVPTLRRAGGVGWYVAEVTPAAEWRAENPLTPCCGNDESCCGRPADNGVPRAEPMVLVLDVDSGGIDIAPLGDGS